jgi:hypothetical protein
MDKDDLDVYECLLISAFILIIVGYPFIVEAL